VLAAAVASACTSRTSDAARSTPVPRFDHVVVVVFENHDQHQILGNADAPFFNELAHAGASFTDAHAEAHPSQPNYLALFSGSTHGVTSDTCPLSLEGPNLGSSLLAAGRSFAGYAEGLPHDGFTGCTAGRYVRKHNPWVDFGNVPAESNLGLERFPTAYDDLPSVAFVIPDRCNDMHDCSVATGDAWLRAHLGGYAAWVGDHNSLLIVTFDEDAGTAANQNRIATFFVGARVKPGAYRERIDHVRILRTIEAAFGLSHAGAGASAAPITGVWN
jgi:acid phosphatase